MSNALTKKVRNGCSERLITAVERNGVFDLRVLNAIRDVPRHIFLCNSLKSHAQEDIALPIGFSQTISQPSVVARMTEALEVTDRIKVLEIGSGSGYQTAVLALLCRRVYTIERHKILYLSAKKHLHSLSINNVTARHGDGSLGWKEQAPFERILVTAAASDIPALLLSQLGPGGVLVAPVGFGEQDQRLIRIRRHGTEIESEDLGPIYFVPLVPGLATD
jgi:protein-L-isoaspartate(D-aspartate) O-methyltransferase